MAPVAPLCWDYQACVLMLVQCNAEDLKLILPLGPHYGPRTVTMASLEKQHLGVFE